MRNPKNLRNHLRALRSSALVIALLGITLVTVLVLTLFLVTRSERKSASLALGKAASESLADLAADLAVLKMKEATEDGMSSGKMWISEPGRIRVYDRSNLSASTDYDLFSALPGPDTTLRDQNNVDLNRQAFDGSFPIAAPAPGNTRATMKVGWISLPADPGQAASATNPITGRVAFWVDDESCKININTADGSKKEDLYRTIGPSEAAQSFGFGTPGEISLEALTDSGNVHLSNTTAAEIAAYAWNRGFNSPAEIGRIPGLPGSFFEHNKFSITHYSKTPELTFYGEPRIYLLPVVPLSSGLVRTLLNGGYGNYGTESVAGTTSVTDPVKKSVSAPIDFIYPISHPTLNANNQFSYPIPLNPVVASYESNSGSTISANNLSFIKRIANAINGKDSSGNPVQWPAFQGNTSGFSTKYSPRQIDSIALQIHDISNTCVFPDQYRCHSLPSIAFDGVINTDTSQPRSVIGIGRMLKLTEISIQASASPGSINGIEFPYLKMRTDMEFYFPQFYQGAPLHSPYDVGSTQQFRLRNMQAGVGYSNGQLQQGPNQVDMQKSDTAVSWLGGFWGDNLLHIDRQGNETAGVDLVGNDRLLDDPDPAKALAYHPFLQSGSNSPKGSVASILTTPRFWSPLEISSPITPTNPTVQSVFPGTYFSQPNRYKDSIFYPARPGTAEFRFRGGLSVWNRTGSAFGGWNQWEPVPLDGLRGPFTGESPSLVASQLRQTVIPVAFAFSLDAPNGAGAEHYILQVADPLVNKFPGDWQVQSTLTMMLNSDGNSYSWIYQRGGSAAVDSASFPPPSDIAASNLKFIQLQNSDGDNLHFRPSGGGDPLSIWLPRQDIRYPKQSRFPSVGALNFVRTGMIPDNLSASLGNQTGTPWRSINFSAASASSQSVHGSAYPDWAMLDLFTVPYLPQKPYATGNFSNPPLPPALTFTETPFRKLTYGGATEGRININNPRVPYPFDQDPSVNPAPPVRTAPLEALFYGIRPSRYQDDAPEIAAASKVDHAALAKAVTDYLNSTDGSGRKKRFLLPGQLADLPEIDAYTYDGVAANARSRNDLLKQVVGATCTQSNVFSIWVVAQSLKKSPKGTDPSRFEPGDVILGETRRRYLVERHLEFGADGVPGNAVNPGSDGFVGTEDDPINTTYHPKLPFPLPYRWRIVAVETF
ncbi:MAG: hypothetical protein IAE94_10325 [Chthoniobacterales bacterium]|nr:hypothetical protein [Chthoniobacterales bacterium]